MRPSGLASACGSPTDTARERQIFLAFDQQLAEGLRLRVAGAWEMHGWGALGGVFDSMGGDRRLRFLSASGEVRPPEPDPPERVVIDLRLPGPDDPDTD